jgi:hypothetical protein
MVFSGITFHPWPSKNIHSGKNINDLQPTLDKVLNAEVKQFLKNLDAITDDEDFKRVASFRCEFRFESGYSKPFVHLICSSGTFVCPILCCPPSQKLINSLMASKRATY